MCGIAGIFGQQPLAKLYVQLFEALAHRGPDASGSFGDAHLRMGMHRLKFRGDDSKLPMMQHAAVAAYNGQVYGHFDNDGRYIGGVEGLEQELAIAGEHRSVDGMFAYARYSREGARLQLATDAHFIKPLFLRRGVDSVAFASELAPLLTLGGPPKVDMDALAELFACGWYLGDQTCSANISMVWKNDVTVTMSGIEPHPKHMQVVPARERPNPTQLRRAISQSVSRSVQGAGPLGLALSGGLDSSILAFELNALGVEGLVCITVCTDGGDDISSLADLGLPTGQAWQTWRHVKVHVDDSDFLRGFEASTRLFGQPTTMSSLPLYQRLAEAASEAGVRALLLGEGVDEYFAGYASYAKVAALPSQLDYYRHTPREALVRELFGAKRSEGVHRRFLQLYSATPDLREVESQLRLTRLLLRSDVCLMSRSIEGRVPFLYNNIPSMALAIPWAELAAFPGKSVLRHAYAEALGNRVTRAKVRFKSSDAMLLRCLDLQGLEQRIVESCADLFGRAAVQSALSLLRRSESFDADILCLLMSLTFLIEGELLYDDVSIPTGTAQLYA